MKHKCPDEERLADYLEGRLSGPDRRRMEAHLAGCGDCLDMVAPLLRTDGPAAAEAPEAVTAAAIHLVAGLTRKMPAPSRPVPVAKRSRVPSLTERFQTWLAGFAPAPAPLAAGIRGTAGAGANRTVAVHRRFGDLAVVIDMEETGTGVARLRVRPETDDGDMAGVRVTLIRDGREAASLVLEPGGVVFDPVAFGRGRLIFTRAGEEIGVYGFDLRAT